MGFSAVPLGHKFTAVLVAAAAAYGAHTWLERRATETAATAELSFSLHAARRLDAGFVHANEPAVVFAESVLSDQKIAALSKPAYLSTAGMMSRVGEFRSRLELTQPSAEVLGIRFRDADSGKAVQTANAIADALVAWSPSPDAPGAVTEPAPAATAQPAAQQAAKTAASRPAPALVPAPAPVKRAAKKEASGGGSGEGSANSGPLETALGELQARLESTSRDVQEGASAAHARHGYEGRAYALSEQQRMIKSEVHEAQKQVSDLRAQYGKGGDGQRLGVIQGALASVLAGGKVGVSASQVSREREGLARAMSVVEEQRAAIEKETRSGADSGAAGGPTPAASAPSSASPAAQSSGGTGSKAITESDLTKAATPAASPPSTSAAASAPVSSQPSGASSAESVSEDDAALANPFRMEKPAGTAAAIQWWPAAAAGIGCGLLYWILMAMVSGGRQDDGYVEETVSYGRFITPDAPVPAAATVAEPVMPEVVERGTGKRASFTYEPGPAEKAAQMRGAEAAGAPAVATAAAVAVEEKRGADESAAAPVTTATVAREAFHQEKPAEKVVEIDPWADLMQKALSETDIGRSFEKPAERPEEAAKDDAARRSMRPDRLAG